MKVLIFSSYYHPHRGGVEIYTASLCKYLRRAKIEPTIITCNTEGIAKNQKIEDTKVVYLDCWHILRKTLPIPKLNRRNKLIIKRLLQQRPTWILTQTRFFPLSFWAAYLAKKHHLNHLHIEHGCKHAISNSKYRTKLYHLYDHLFGKYIITNAKINFAISKEGIPLLKHLGAKKYALAPNSIEIEKFNLPRRKNKTYKTIIYVGRLIEQKGVQDLILAFKKINTSKNKLVIIGSGYYLKKLEEMSGDNPNIIFKGELDRNEIAKELAQADLFVNPSYAEGLPTSVLEAGAAGLPIIATDVGGTKEIIQNGKNGFLVKPKNIRLLTQKINILLNNRKLSGRFSKNIRQTIMINYNWSKNINIFLRLFSIK